ncbi:MarR family winged helix-turn-helix transcriptional regulator [Streptomyces sp. NPDC055058]
MPRDIGALSAVAGFPRQVVERPAPAPRRQLAEYRTDPAHRRAKLLAPTGAGRAAVARIDPGHAAFADRLAQAFGEEDLERTVRLLGRLSEVLDGLGPPEAARPVTAPAPVTEP